jgi:hypothetical protein
MHPMRVIEARRSPSYRVSRARLKRYGELVMFPPGRAVVVGQCGWLDIYMMFSPSADEQGLVRREYGELKAPHENLEPGTWGFWASTKVAPSVGFGHDAVVEVTVGRSRQRHESYLLLHGAATRASAAISGDTPPHGPVHPTPWSVQQVVVSETLCADAGRFVELSEQSSTVTYNAKASAAAVAAAVASVTTLPVPVGVNVTGGWARSSGSVGDTPWTTQAGTVTYKAFRFRPDLTRLKRGRPFTQVTDAEGEQRVVFNHELRPGVDPALLQPDVVAGHLVEVTAEMVERDWRDALLSLGIAASFGAGVGVAAIRRAWSRSSSTRV